MNANIRASAAELARPIQVLFKAGQFVRVTGGNAVGRVLEDTMDETSSTRVQVFDDDSWGNNPSFGPGALTMWTPDEICRATSPKPVPKPPLDVMRVLELMLKITGAWELTSDLVRSARAEADQSAQICHAHESLINNIELIADTFGDMAGEILEMLQAEIDRLRDAKTDD
jgi:hypothetical protein